MRELPILFSTEIAEEEEWRPIPGYGGRYEISNYGRVKSLSTYHKKYSQYILKPWVGNKHYQYVDLKNSLRRKTHAIHRLVLESFVGPCPPGKQAAHWDGNPQNNYVGNLRWATAKENIADRKRHGRTKMGEEQGSAKLDRGCVKTIKKMKILGFSAHETGRLACVSTTTIERIWRGETWKHV